MIYGQMAIFCKAFSGCYSLCSRQIPSNKVLWWPLFMYQNLRFMPLWREAGLSCHRTTSRDSSVAPINTLLVDASLLSWYQEAQQSTQLA